MKRVVLHGALGEEFGEEWNLDVRTPAEALRLIEANTGKLLAHLHKSAEQGVGYRVILGERDIDETLLAAPYGRETLHFVPVLAGAKSGGGTFIIGAILMIVAIVAAPFTGGASLSLAAAIQGVAAGTATWGALAVSVAMSIGTSLAVSGLSQMLAGTPDSPGQTESALTVNKTSYYFNGPSQTAAQGSAIPVGYGEMIVGSLPISAGLNAENWVE